MAAVRIVTDSACDLTKDEAAALQITVVPLTIRFGDEELTDGVQLGVSEFYARMATTAKLPETAAPSPGLFEEAFRAAAADGASGVVCIDLSSSLSATMSSAQLAAEAVKDTIDVRVVDSRSIASGLGTQVLRAAQSARDGISLDDIEATARDYAGRTHVVATLDTLDNLKKGGRIGGAQAMIGSLLNVKPVIDISSGVVEQAAKPRTRRKSLEWLRDHLFAAGEVDGLCISHGEAPDIDDFLTLIESRYPRDQVRVSVIGPVIGSHGGPRVLGVTYFAT